MSERKLTHEHERERKDKTAITTTTTTAKFDLLPTVGRKPTIYARAKTIKNIHKSSVSDIWLVESGTTKGKFYCVKYDPTINALACECIHFTMGAPVCKHIVAACLLGEKDLRK
jgi:hypothetical protein